jgi:hypothetical protein
MKQIIIFSILLLTILQVSAQFCDPVKFKKLESTSQKVIVTDSEFTDALTLVRNLERNKCSDYIKKRNGEEYVVASLTYLFGEICLKNNSSNAVHEYINYMKRHHGSTEEQISFSLERLFVKQPGYVLSSTGYNKDLLNQLVWGFVNNHYYTEKDQKKVTKNGSSNIKPQLNKANYKALFYRINPKVKAIYPKYKKAIDYLLNEIGLELKG